MTAKLLTSILLASILSGCSQFFDDNEAKRVAEDNGFSDVVITGRRLVGCGREDAYRVGFAATNSKGKHVTGVVCAGLFVKAYTVRLD